MAVVAEYEKVLILRNPWILGALIAKELEELCETMEKWGR